MEILFVLVPLALLLSGAGLALFFRAVASGQFEDLDGDGARFLLEPPADYADESKRDKTGVSLLDCSSPENTTSEPRARSTPPARLSRRSC